MSCGSRDEAAAAVGGGGVGASVAAPGPRNMESIVGRRAAPKGVERKSAGRSSALE